MILRSVMKHVRDQNWLALALDFCIVVIGVFVGLQVQQWADAQRQARLESLYTQRLHQEVVDLLAARAPLVELRNELGEALSAATQALFDGSNRELTELECRSIAFSYIVSNPTDGLASLLELQSSGQLSLFSNPRVSRALGTFLLTRTRVRDAHEAAARGAMNLSSRHPDLIQGVAPSDFSATPWIFPTYRCDLEGMRVSASFVNEFESNQMIYRFHIENNSRIDNSLRDLRQVLQEVLGITAGTTLP